MPLRAIAGGGSGSSITVAPGWRPTSPSAGIYAQFTQPTQSYYGGGAQTTSFSTWLTSVSGTFTRSGSVGPAWDASGLLVNYAANQPRLSYDPVTLVPNLIYEPASANLITFSQQPAAVGTSWAFANTGITRTDSNATGLDGTTSAGTFRELTPNTQHLVWFRDASITLTSGNFYAFQIFIKGVNRTRIRIIPSSVMGATAFILDLTNATASDPSWTVERLVNGYLRLYKTFTAASSSVPDIRFYLLDSTGSDTYAGSTSAGWNLGGAQMEQVASATSLPSTYMQRPNATAVSRSADALAFTLPSTSSSLTYSFANGQTQLVSVSPGAYSVPTTLNRYQITSLVDVDLTQVSSPVLTVAGRIGNVALSQSDITGLKTTDIGTFSALSLSTGNATIGTSSITVQNTGSFYRWGNSGSTLNGRYVIIGGTAGNALLSTSQSNTVIIGYDAGSGATSVAASVVVGDTAGGGNAISGVVAVGNEAGNVGSSGSTSGSNFIGNLAGKSSTNATHTRSEIIGQNGSRNVALTDSIVIGNGAAYDTAATSRALTQSVILGSTAGNTITGAGTSTGLILIGYGAQPATPTTSNYLNIGGAFKGDMSGGTYSVTTSAGGDALLTVANLLLSNLPTSSPGITGRIWNNAGVLNISP